MDKLTFTFTIDVTPDQLPDTQGHIAAQLLKEPIAKALTKWGHRVTKSDIKANCIRLEGVGKEREE